MDDFDDINPRSWRTLQSGRKDRSVAATPIMRRRRLRAFFKWVYAVLIVAVIALGIAWGVRYLRANPEAWRMGEPLQPVRTLDFTTNGVLTKAWLEHFIGFDAATGMEPDVRALQKTLESRGQIRTAALERSWPDVLRVRITEEEPVARLVVGAPGGTRKTLLVSRRGVVYEGACYAQGTLNELPYLDGVVLRQTQGGYEPIPGMETVAKLLDDAFLRLPNLRAQWQVISLEDFEGRTDVPWAVIRVRSANLGEIVFAPRDFPRQLDALATAVNDFAVKNQKIRRIDLSMDGLGVAQLADPPPAKPKPQPSRPATNASPVRLLPAGR